VEQQARSASRACGRTRLSGGQKLTVPDVRPPREHFEREERAGTARFPSAPVVGERPTLFHQGLREWLRVTLIVSLAAHAIAFLVFQFRFDDDLERAAGAAAALASDGTITVPVELVTESMLPSAPSPADASASDAEQANPTPPIDLAQPAEPDLAKLVELMPPPPEPAPVVLPTPESLVQLPEPPEPAPVVSPTQQEAMELALPEEEIAKPIEAETSTIAEAPAARLVRNCAADAAGARTDPRGAEKRRRRSRPHVHPHRRNPHPAGPPALAAPLPPIRRHLRRRRDARCGRTGGCLVLFRSDPGASSASSRLSAGGACKRHHRGRAGGLFTRTRWTRSLRVTRERQWARMSSIRRHSTWCGVLHRTRRFPPRSLRRGWRWARRSVSICASRRVSQPARVSAAKSLKRPFAIASRIPDIKD
jgi:outer membrane biosynthesis protein TonB